MDNIAIFYHVWQAHDWRTLFQQQIMSMHVSGLLAAADQIYVCCNGSESLPFDHERFVIRRNSIMHNESQTLQAMWRYCDINPNSQVLYIHTKGLSRGTALSRAEVDAWRLYLEYYVIHHWQRCCELLREHDAVGTEWMESAIYMGPRQQRYALANRGIFVGNFWWARAAYVRQLDPDFLMRADAAHEMEGTELDDQDLTPDDIRQILRFNSELWIGTGDAKIYSFNRLHTRFYDTNVMDRLQEITCTPRS